MHADDHLNTIRNRQDNANLDEVPYADDTIHISPSTGVLNRMLAEPEEAAGLYGLKLNKAKSVAITRRRI